MSRQRRSFSSKFKSDLVIELLKDKKDLNTLTAENNIQPICCAIEKRTPEQCSIVFDDKRAENERKSGACKKGWSVNHASGLAQKNLKKCADLTLKVSLVQSLLTTKELLSSVGAGLLGPASTIRDSPPQRKNWPVRRSWIAFIRIIQPGEQDRCRHN